MLNLINPFNVEIEDVPVNPKTKLHRYRKDYSPKNTLKFIDTADNSTHYFSFCDLENKTLINKENDDNNYAYTISTYDPNLNIRITATNTIFSVSIIIDQIIINIYKKVLHNPDNIVKSIIENQQVYKGKVINELCKMSEFIYENIDYIKTLIKIKCVFMKKIKIFHQYININTNELNKLKLYKEWFNHESEKPFNLNSNTEFYTYSETQKYTYGNPWLFYTTRLTNIHNELASEVINKQSAEFVKNLNLNELLPNCYKSRWLIKTKNKLFIGQPLYNKFINNNKYLNYYYGKPITNLKYQAFDVSVDNKYQSIRQKSKDRESGYDFTTFIKYDSIINIVVSQPITDNFNIDSNLKDNIEILSKNEIITKQLIDDIGLETFYMIYRLLKNWTVFYYFFPLPFKEDYERFKIYINEYIANIMYSAVENLKYNLDNYDILSPFLDKVLTRKITTLFIITNFTNIKSKRLTSDILKERNIEVLSKEYNPIIILDKEVKKEHLIFLINQKFTSESMATYEKFITRIGLRLL